MSIPHPQTPWPRVVSGCGSRHVPVTTGRQPPKVGGLRRTDRHSGVLTTTDVGDVALLRLSTPTSAPAVTLASSRVAARKRWPGGVGRITTRRHRANTCSGRRRGDDQGARKAGRAYLGKRSRRRSPNSPVIPRVRWRSVFACARAGQTQRHGQPRHRGDQTTRHRKAPPRTRIRMHRPRALRSRC